MVLGKTRETIHFRLRRKNERKDRQRESLATVESFRRRRLYFFLVPHTRARSIFPVVGVSSFYQRERETFSSYNRTSIPSPCHHQNTIYRPSERRRRRRRRPLLLPSTTTSRRCRNVASSPAAWGSSGDDWSKCSSNEALKKSSRLISVRNQSTRIREKNGSFGCEET